MQIRLGLALFAALVGCSTAQPLPSPLTSRQAEAFAKEVLRHTPELTHFARGTTFEWVYFEGVAGDSFSELSEPIAQALAARYRVYRRPEEFPPHLEVVDDMGTSYLGGFLLSIEVRRESAHEIVVTYMDYEGPLAASHQTISYRWSGETWVPVRIGDLWVA